MNTLKTICALLLSVALLPASAQERTTMGIQYQYGLPMGDFKNTLIKDGSPRGASIDIQYAINPRWRIGGAVGYQDFYQKNPRQTYKMSDGSDISAVVTNSLQTTALLAKASFLPLGADSSRLQPYISLGAGANMVQYNQLLGEFASSDDVWVRFAAQGGAGIQYAVGGKGQTALSLGVVYNYMPLNGAGVKNINNLAVQAGVRFALRNNGGNSRSGDVWRQRRPNNYDPGWGW